MGARAMTQIPEGFVLESEVQATPAIPEGFVLEAEAPVLTAGQQAISNRDVSASEALDTRRSQAEQNSADPRAKIAAFMATLSPEETEVLEGVNNVESFLIGAGERFANLGRGIGVMDQADESEIRAMQALNNDSPLSSAAGGLTGEVAPWLIPGAKASQIPGVGARMATTAGLGVAEGALNARGEGEDAAGIAQRAALTGVTAGLLGGLFPSTPTRSQQAIIDTIERGAPSQEIDDVVRALDANASPEDIARITADSEHPLAIELNEIAQSGDDVANRSRQVIDQAQEDLSDNSMARYLVDGRGMLRSDPLARDAIKQGFDDGMVAAIKGANRADRSAMQQMLAVLRRGRNDARYAAENRPADIVGDSLMERLTAVQNVRTEAAEELNTVARTLRSTDVDVSPAKEA